MTAFDLWRGALWAWGSLGVAFLVLALVVWIRWAIYRIQQRRRGPFG